MILGALDGAFLLATFLPMLPHVHPRTASGFDDPTARASLEPPGFAGLNYGRRRPLTTSRPALLRAILGAGYSVSGS